MISGGDVIFDDRYVTVVNKPHGLQCEPDKHGHPNLVDELRKYLNKMNKPPKILQTVNRLDRPVAGLVLFAKTSSALRVLNEQQEERRIKKVYKAVLEGVIVPETGLLEHFHHKDTLNKRAVIHTSQDAGAKPCSLSYMLLSATGDESTVQISLHTGRYHQIRAQFAFIGHPIVGDAYYGSTRSYKPQSICLRATGLTFNHPIHGESVPLQWDIGF